MSADHLWKITSARSQHSLKLSAQAVTCAAKIDWGCANAACWAGQPAVWGVSIVGMGTLLLATGLGAAGLAAADSCSDAAAVIG